MKKYLTLKKENYRPIQLKNTENKPKVLLNLMQPGMKTTVFTKIKVDILQEVKGRLTVKNL